MAGPGPGHLDADSAHNRHSAANRASSPAPHPQHPVRQHRQPIRLHMNNHHRACRPATAQAAYPTFVGANLVQLAQAALRPSGQARGCAWSYADRKRSMDTCV